MAEAMDQVVTQALEQLQVKAMPETMPDEASAKDACLKLWEDSTQLLDRDPLVRHFGRDDPLGEIQAETRWRTLYTHMMRSERDLFATERQVNQPGTQKFNVQMAPPVLHLKEEYYPHPWEDTRLVGCSNKYAFVAAAMTRKDKKAPRVYDLYRAPIDDWQVSCEYVMPRMQAQTSKPGVFDMEARISRGLREVHAQKPCPVWERVEGTKMRSAPLLSALSLETGHVCVILAEEQDRLVMFQAHASRGDEVRLGNVKLASGLPDEIVCSSQYVALRYNRLLASEIPAGTPVPDTKEGTQEAGLLPPHVQVLPIMRSLADCSSKEYEEQRLVQPALHVFLASEADHYWRMSKVDFHENHPNILYVALRNEAIHTLMISRDGQELFLHPVAEPIYVSLTAAQLADMYRRNPTAATTSALECKPSNQYRSLHVRAVGERADEVRILALGLSHLSTVSGSEDQHAAKQGVGKTPVTYTSLSATCVSAHNCGNLVVLHEAHSNGVMLHDFATGKQMALFTPSTGRDDTTVIPPCEQWCQTTRCFSNRVCVLMPLGYLFFVQQNDKVFEQRYQDVRAAVAKQIADERMKERKLMEALKTQKTETTTRVKQEAAEVQSSMSVPDEAE